MGLTVDDLLAKEEIREVIFRYARGIDRMDFDLVTACYHADAYDDHGTFQGNVPDFIEMCRGFLPRFVCTQHFMGNMLRVHRQHPRDACPRTPRAGRAYAHPPPGSAGHRDPRPRSVTL